MPGSGACRPTSGLVSFEEDVVASGIDERVTGSAPGYATKNPRPRTGWVTGTNGSSQAIDGRPTATSMPDANSQQPFGAVGRRVPGRL